MAYTYASSPNLSKVRMGNVTYYLKDADVRAILDTFGNVVTLDKATTVTSSGTGLVDAALMYDYVGRQVGALGQALNLLSEDDHSDVASPQAGDFVVESDGTEWLYDGEEWREIGSENAYVVKTFSIAGIDMQDNITAAELQTALGLKALAYKDNGSVKVTTIDSINSISTAASGTYDVSTTSVSVPATYNSLDVTPAGSVEVSAGTAAAASYDKTTSVTIAAAAPSGEVSANYTPTGSVEITNVTVTPATGSAATVSSAGQAYQLTDGSVTQAVDSKAGFATEGVVLSVGSGDDAETLIVATASTASAVTAAGAVTYVAPVLSGSLPTFGTVGVVTGITSASATASFTGDGTVISATPGYTSANATMTQPTFTATFSGTSKSVTPSVATTVSAAAPGGTVTVSAQTVSITANSTEKTVQVSFGVNA